MTYKVRLDIFEGPLDLLLYLIKRDELNIYDIPVNRITAQYLEHLEVMQMLDLDVAGEFLVMAATLMQIKSKMLLPPEAEAGAGEEADPRAELVRRLLEYKSFKEAAEQLRDFEGKRRGFFTRTGVEPEIDAGDSPFLEVSVFELLAAFSKILKNLPKEDTHQVIQDEFTIAEKVHELFHRLMKEQVVYFSALFQKAKNKIEVITVFLALLELIRLKEVAVMQSSHFGEIEIRRNVLAPEAHHGAP